jgi:hypothetical protein
MAERKFLDNFQEIYLTKLQSKILFILAIETYFNQLVHPLCNPNTLLVI